MSDPHAAPASSPADDEPKTPMWLPALGAALFVSIGLWWAVTPPAAPPTSQAATLASASAHASATATPAAPAGAPAPTPTQAPAALASAGPARAGDADSAAMQEKLKQLRERFGAQPPAPPPPPGAKGGPAR